MFLLIVLLPISIQIGYAQSKVVGIDISDDLMLKASFWARDEFFTSWMLGGIYQDSRGIVWLQSGTQLCYFDGRQVKAVEEEQGGLYDYATAHFAEDRRGHIWRYTEQASSKALSVAERINIYDPRQDSFASLQAYIREDSLPLFSENILLYSLEQRVYISDIERAEIWCHDHGQLQLAFKGPREQEGEFFFYLAGPTGYYWAIGNKTSVRLLSEKGIVVADYSGEQATIKPEHFFVAPNGELWRYIHLLRYPQAYTLPAAVPYVPLLSNAPVIPAIQVIRSGKISTLLSSIQYLQGQAQSLYNPSVSKGGLNLIKDFHSPAIFFFPKLSEQLPELNSKSIITNTQALTLRDGSILAPSSAGLLHLKLEPRYFTSYMEGQSVRGLAVIDSTQLAAVRITESSSEVAEVDLSSGIANTVYSELFKAPMYSLKTEGDSIWLGLALGNVQVCDKAWNVRTTYPFPKEKYYWEARSFLRISDSIYWYTTTAGVVAINTLRQSSRFVIEQQGTNWLHRDRSDNLWVGTENGLYHLTEGRFYLDSLPNGSPIRISHIYEDRTGVFWLATQSGLLKWRPYEATYELFAESFGLPDQIVHAIYPDRLGRLWLSTNNGIAVFEPETQKVVSFFRIDGLAGNEQNFMSHTATPDGWLFFGGIEGVTRFEPDKIRVEPDTFSYDFSLNKLSLSNSSGEPLTYYSDTKLALQEIIQLPLRAWQMEVDFFFPCYSTKPYRVEWRQTGGDNTWQEVGEENKIVLYNLPHGDFEIQLRAYYLDQTPNTIVRTLSFYRPWPIYQRTWFYFVLIGSVVLLTLQLTKDYTRRIKKRNQELQQAVDQKTRTLQQQKEQLERLDQTKTVFFRNVSHELRTPLAIIKTAAEELEQLKGKEERYQVQLIADQSRHLQEMIELIMSLSKLDSGMIKLKLEPIDWTSLISTVVSSFTGIAQHRQIHLQLITSPSQPIYVRTDPIKIQQILSNLIGNALKFSTSGGRIVVRSQVMEEEKEIEIVVADNGPGIPAAEQAIIFKRYQQGKEGEDSDHIGYGIGLALCAEYVRLFKGRIWVESVVHEGASFFIRLPLERISPLDARPQASLTKEPKREARLLPKLLEEKEERPSLLVVEDNSHLKDQLERILSRHYEVTTATNGKEAYEILKAYPQRFDLLITDVMMPMMDGFALLGKIRSHETLGFLPVLFVTALSMGDEELRAFRLGVDGYLSKPFERIELLTRVDNLVQNQVLRKKFQNELEKAPRVMSEPDQSFQGLSYDEGWLQKLEQIVQENLSRPDFTVSEIANKLNLTERTLRNHVKSYTGLSPLAYLRRARLDRAFLHIKKRHYQTVSEVAYSVGFKDAQYFSKLFKKEFGKLPNEYM